MELRKVNANNTILTVLLSGDLDANGSKEALPHIDQIIAEDHHPEIEIDLKHVSFIDSSGIGAIVYLYKRLVEKQRNMRIENAQGQPLEIITLLRINQAISVNAKREAQAA